MPIEFTVKGDLRIEKALKDKMPYASMGDIFKLFRKGDVKINGKRIKDSKQKVHSGDSVWVFADPDKLRQNAKVKQQGETARLTEKNLKVIFEDDILLVCDKPSGVAVHEGKGIRKGTTLLDLAQHYGKEQSPRYVPHLIHRLDSDTSGVILLTKEESFLEEMIELFRNEKIDKKYVALCHGRFKHKEGTIKAALSRKSSKNHGMNVTVDSHGRKAHSEFRVIHQYVRFALVEVKIYTGRTHQIRTHMAHIGHPVVGDSRYGDEKLDNRLKHALPQGSFRLFLHAREISFPLPGTGKYVTFSAKIPALFKELGKKSMR